MRFKCRRCYTQFEELEKRNLLTAVVGNPFDSAAADSRSVCLASDPIPGLTPVNATPANSGPAAADVTQTIESSQRLIGPIQQAAPPALSITDATVIEGNSGTSMLTFDVTLSAAATETVTVDVHSVDEDANAIVVERLTSGLSSPIYLTAAPDDPDNLFIVEQGGVIQRIDRTTGSVAATPFLTVDDVSVGSERGLLGLAFHPDYATNHQFYVYMTDSSGDSLIRQYLADADGLTADATSAVKVLGYDQPHGNHNGGWIDFGPDGYLYIASGDGGSRNDPHQNSQTITGSLLGKLLRIDVNGDDFPGDDDRNYAIPATNPFVDVDGDDEIWAFGLRNPWRNSFDRLTGDLVIADVGQDYREEINFQPASSSGGENYGWRAREGTIETASVGGPKPVGAIDPIYDYSHGNQSDQGFSVTGGYVYRGPIEQLRGNYFFADYVNERIWSLRPDAGNPSGFDGTNYSDFTDWTTLFTPDVGTIDNISSFGEDHDGNLYVVDRGGEVFRISSGADYQSTTQTLTFQPGQLTQTVSVTVVGDRLPESNETLQAVLSNPSNAEIDDGIGIGTVINDDAPSLIDVVINGHANQRSIVDQIQLRFDSDVQLDASQGDLFRIINRDTQESVEVAPTTTVENGRTIVTLAFVDGPAVDSRLLSPPTLVDGHYQLSINTLRVSIAGVILDGDGDGIAGGDAVFGTQAADRFFRFFGDTDGDADVDGQDYRRFATTYLVPGDQPAHDPSLDFNGDGDVDSQDYGQFSLRFRRQL
ncbi:PQQ-dependent sugar dehydrogenase [Stieleria sp. TO1_6]|uniref:PQQ-dependent sugar dehydrogenase n=1 Tax=Stieleria tagensis TaxID=2956795 RepID=UPI00209AA187|nr:PQQ-dependent sugar dehydrogenase [Stieleria tagensis]MCO8121629.1 PQQ-dependent sugar dehydrogenase [Stieleria tagensis]